MDARLLTTLAADAWATRNGGLVLAYERPDEEDRQGPAVDLLGRDSQGVPRLVLEHTLVESFIDQRTAQIAAIRMFKPLEGQLTGQLPAPGHYTLTIKPPAVLGLKREVGRIRAWAERWIREKAPTLALASPDTAPRHFATIAVPDTNLEIMLSRRPRRDGHFSLNFEAPPDTGEALSPSLERALRAKCPKLATAKAANHAATSLLLLEISDIQLGNLFDLDAVVVARLASEVEEAPDHIWLVDTADHPPSVMISKVGRRVGEELGERFLPFLLRPA